MWRRRMALRQYRALNEASRRRTWGKLVRTEYGSGDVLTMTLMEKLILLSAVKFATLDAYGMGIEMEGGKPGWYDAPKRYAGTFRFFHGGDLRGWRACSPTP